MIWSAPISSTTLPLPASYSRAAGRVSGPGSSRPAVPASDPPGEVMFRSVMVTAVALTCRTLATVAVATVDRPSAETNTGVPHIDTSRLISVTVSPPSRSTLPARAR